MTKESSEPKVENTSPPPEKPKWRRLMNRRPWWLLLLVAGALGAYETAVQTNMITASPITRAIHQMATTWLVGVPVPPISDLEDIGFGDDNYEDGSVVVAPSTGEVTVDVPDFTVNIPDLIGGVFGGDAEN